MSLALLLAGVAIALLTAARHRPQGGRGRWLLHAIGPALLVAAVLALPHRAMADKLLTRLALPAGLLWAGLLAGAWLTALRQRHRLSLMLVAGWVLYTAAGSGWLGDALLASLERGYALPPASARFEAIAVLGGGTDETPWGAPQLSLSGDRVRVAGALWRGGQTPLLVASGTSIGGLDQPHRRDLGAETRALWAQMGVDPRAVITVPGPFNTRTEIEALAAEAHRRGWTRVGLVTSAWHLRRAMRLAERFDLPAVPIPADVRGGVAPLNALGLVPTGSGFYRVQIALKEYLAALVGR